VTFGLGWGALRTRRGLLIGSFAAATAFLAMSVLGVASSLPLALSAPEQRENARFPSGPGFESSARIAGQPLAGNQLSRMWNGRRVEVIEVAARQGATAPPGVDTLPAPGTGLVSPELAQVMREHPGALAAQIPNPVDEIAWRGLADPHELFAYVGIVRGTVPTPLEIAGWGSPGTSQLRRDISPLVGIPIALVAVLPVLGLLATVLWMDDARRRARLACLQLLGAMRRQRLMVDIGFLVPPLFVGWIVAWIAEPAVDDFVVMRLMAGRPFFPQDLRVEWTVRLGVGLVLASLVVAASLRDLDPESIMRDLRRRAAYRLTSRVAMGGVSIALGLALGGAVLTSGESSQLRSYPGLIGSAALLIGGTVMVNPVLPIGVCRALTFGSASGQLAVGRIRGSRSGWRAATLSLILFGAVAGLALSALAGLDVATQTDQIMWNPSLTSDNVVYASLPPTDVRARRGAEHDIQAFPAVPDGDVFMVEGTQRRGPLPSMRVDCAQLGYFIDVRVARDPCRSAWVIDDGVNPYPPTASIQRADGTHVRDAVRATADIAPAEILGSSTVVLIPSNTAEVDEAVRKTAVLTLTAILLIDNAEQVEDLRNALWHHDGAAIYGASGPLAPVVTRADLVRAGHEYRDRYSPLVVGLLSIAALSSLGSVAMSGAVEGLETRGRDRILIAMGIRPRSLSTTRWLGVLVPGLTAIAAGGALGAVLGVGYADLADRAHTRSAVAGFPARPYLQLIVIEAVVLTAACILAVSAVARTRSVNAGEVGDIG